MTKVLAPEPALGVEEADALKYTLALVGASKLINDFELPRDDAQLESFYKPLRHLATLQPFSERIQPYGMAYLGRPEFMTDALVSELREEAQHFRAAARPLARNDHLQYLYQSDEPTGDLLCERLAEAPEVLALVERHAGPVRRSFVTNYIYYDLPGQCSKPHVDNHFTAVTAMVGLRHDAEDGSLGSSSVVYWPDKPRFDYALRPGEIAIFFGVSALHGRTPVASGETVHSLLLSFRPIS